MIKNSIEKLNAQIDMLENNKFVEKEKTTSYNIPKKNRKVILEETTRVEEDLMSDLIGTNEETKVYNTLLNKTNEKLLETISIGNITVNQKKVEDIYLPIFLGLIIFVLIIFIIMI